MSDRTYDRFHHAGSLPTPTEAVGLLESLIERAKPVPLSKVDRPIVLYGAGNLGALARDHLETVGHRAVLVVDRDADSRRKETGWSDYEMCVPAKALASLKQDAILAISISTRAYMPLSDALAAEGWSRRVPFYDVAQAFRALHPLNNGWAAASLSGAEMAATQEVLKAWDDDRSRADHLRFIAWRLAREEWTFDGAEVGVDDRFFIPEAMPFLGPNARVLDAGAHHGSYLDLVIRKSPGVARVWAVEPDAQNRERLQQWVASLPEATRTAVTIHDMVLSDGEAVVPFHEGLNYASQISPTGSIMRKTNAIDSCGWAPTLIKLHLEGHELAALKGAKATIEAERPLILATIYHNEDGLFRTAEWLMTNLRNYRFLLRAHGWCGTGLVIYALPNDRCTD